MIAGVRPLAPRPVALESALGLVLAVPAVAPHDVPPFANSAMDGYAVRSADVGAVPVTLTVTEDVPAGHVASGSVGPGTAIKIMTGAPMPAGADAVVRVEDTEQVGRRVTIRAAVTEGYSVRSAGSDVTAGVEVVPVGRRLTPAMLGVLASVGVTTPIVVGRPRVAMVSTGDEVVPITTEALGPGMIRDSTRPVLGAMLTELGAEVVDLGIVGDDAATLAGVLSEAAASCDAVFTTGGVSMGEYDVVKQVLSDLGTIEFWQVAMQPGKPFAFGLIGGTPLFGLPGNPVSVAVAFEQLARPALLTMMGSRTVLRPRIRARLTESVTTDPSRTVFLRGTVERSGDEWSARLSGRQESNVLSAVAAANGWVVVDRGTERVEAGSMVAVEMFGWPESRPVEEGVT